jgi:DNA mismatch repair protein MutS
MAGMPPDLLKRAHQVLKQLEEKHGDTPHSDNLKGLLTPKVQLSIFDAHTETFEEIRSMLNSIDINRLTPVEALMKLNEIKNKIR